MTHSDECDELVLCGCEMQLFDAVCVWLPVFMLSLCVFVRECLRLCTCVCVSVMQLRIWFSVELWVCQIVCGVLCWIGRCNVYWFKLLYWIVAWTTQEFWIGLWIVLKCVMNCALHWILNYVLYCVLSVELNWYAIQWCYAVMQCSDYAVMSLRVQCYSMQWCGEHQWVSDLRCSDAMEQCGAVSICSDEMYDAMQFCDAVMQCSRAMQWRCSDEMQ